MAMDAPTEMAERRVPIHADGDIVDARQEGRAVAAGLGFAGGDVTLITTAISEVARNILQYGVRGEIVLRAARDGERRGLTIVARDEGPGIPDPALALQDGFSTGGGLGLGLPGSRRMMDEFDLVSAVGNGTTVTMTKWVPSHG